MGKRLTLVLGGARSGKSAHARKLAEDRGSAVLFVATAEPVDDEMAERIARHREERPGGWRTLEAPRGIGPAIERHAGAADLILVDCLSVLAGNIFSVEDTAAAESALSKELDLLLEVYERSAAEWILVSNEVGMGVVPAYPLGRTYRDALGRAHQRLARRADEAYLLVAGLALRLK
jgi:adenosylcobinamide kinase/adenosylcobinamide-phosphate guanylyltransferase